MFNTHKPTLDELPSSKDLLRSTKIALIGAIVILVTIVLPAEYAIDPTGVGYLTGLKKMGEIKQSLAKEAAAQDAKAVSSIPSELTPEKNSNPEDITPMENKNIESDIKKDTISATISPNGGVGLKANMSKGDTITYTWKTDGGALNFDAHGEGGFREFTQYAKGVNKTSYEETITADFDGAHGIFWRNRGGQSVTVTLEVSGEFEKLIRE